MDPAHSLTVPGALDSLARVNGFIAAAARALGIPDHDSYHFQLAADEAVTNLVQHGLAGLPAAASSIDLEFHGHPAGWTLTIRDRGRPFDPAAAPPPDLSSRLRKRKAGGLGVYLMCTLMDQVTYQSAGGENVLSLTRRRG